MHTILVTLTLTLTSDLISRFLYLEHISFIKNNFPQNGLMLDQFRWGIHHVTVFFFTLTALPYILWGHQFDSITSIIALLDTCSSLNVWLQRLAVASPYKHLIQVTV